MTTHFRFLIAAGALGALVPPCHVSAGTGNAVTDWALIVQPAIHSAAAPRPAGSAQVLHTMVVLAMYDAVVAIEGASSPTPPSSRRFPTPTFARRWRRQLTVPPARASRPRGSRISTNSTRSTWRACPTGRRKPTA